MRISLLQKREDFDSIFCKTISAYWSKLFNEPIDIELENLKGIPSENLFSHKYFNFIARQNTPANVFEALEKEYSYNPSWAKRILLKIYFKLSIHRFTLAFFSHQKFYVFPQVPENEPFIFFGGNTRLRIVYPNRKQSVVVLKNGFDRSYIENEIMFRSNRNLEIAPKWFNHDEDKNYFTEAYTPGIPINRLSSITQNQALKQEAMTSLIDEVLAPTKVSKKIDTYVNELFKEVEIHRKMISNDSINEQLLEIVQSLKEELNRFSDDFQIAFSHGDFQEANIILTEKGLKIIDWETVAKRSITYDFFTIYLGARKDMTQEKLWDDSDSFYANFESRSKKELQVDLKEEKEKYLLLFFLEELVYVLKSSCSVAFSENGFGLQSKLPVIKNKMKEFFA